MLLTAQAAAAWSLHGGLLTGRERFFDFGQSPHSVAAKDLIAVISLADHAKDYHTPYFSVRQMVSKRSSVRELWIEGFPQVLVVYTRVSSDGGRQTTALQRNALLAAGVDARHLYEDKASGACADRPGLTRALEFARNGDCLIVWKLNRLGRFLPRLLSIVTGLRERGVAFRSLGLPAFEGTAARTRPLPPDAGRFHPA